MYPDSYYPKPRIWLTHHPLLRKLNDQSLTPNSGIQQYPIVLYSETEAYVFKGYINFRILVLRDLSRFF